MTIELNIEVDDVVEAITEDNTFLRFLDERIEEQGGGEYELPDDVTRDGQLRDYIERGELASEMQDVFRDHDASWLGLPSGESMSDDRLNDHASEMLDSLPLASESRCTLGRNFEAAVIKVLANVLRGDVLVSQRDAQTTMDELLRTAMHRIEQEAVGQPDPSPVFSPLDQVTCDEGSEPHGWVSECRNPVLVQNTDPIRATIGEPVPAGAPYVSPSHTEDDVDAIRSGAQAAPELPRYRVTIDASTQLPMDLIERTAHDMAVGQFGVVGNVQVRVTEAPVPSGEWVRECMVLTMSGQRDGVGSVSVWASRADEQFQVRKNRQSGAGYEVLMTSPVQTAAFSAAFAAAAWGVHVEDNRGE